MFVHFDNSELVLNLPYEISFVFVYDKIFLYSKLWFLECVNTSIKIEQKYCYNSYTFSFAIISIIIKNNWYLTYRLFLFSERTLLVVSDDEFCYKVILDFRVREYSCLPIIFWFDIFLNGTFFFMVEAGFTVLIVAYLVVSFTLTCYI